MASLTDPATSVCSYLSFYDSSTSAALTAAFVEYKFIDKVRDNLQFTSHGIYLIHDNGSGADIEFSRDGAIVEGRLPLLDGSIKLDFYFAKSIYLRGNGADFRFWAW